jgi:hypothetical protein
VLVVIAESPLDESKILITVMDNIFGTGSLWEIGLQDVAAVAQAEVHAEIIRLRERGVAHVFAVAPVEVFWPLVNDTCRASGCGYRRLGAALAR